MDEITKDKRFAHIVKDSRFRTLPKSERKAYIDKRFKDVFSDEKFKLKYEVDKRGRPINLTHKDNLKKFYELQDDQVDDDDDDEEDEEEKDEVEKSDEDDEDGEDEEGSDKSDSDSSSSSDDSEDDDYESPDEKELATEEVIPWNEFDKDTVKSDEISCRLAVCNMDWDRIKAVDLFVALTSFKPADGVIKSVKIYLSEFGAKRLEHERLHGPVELVDDDDDQDNNDRGSESSEGSDDSGDEEGTKFNHRKLRKYQFNRLRYYYAVVECDTKETANHIYTECDGMEYESSSTKFDLRFVPDDMVFAEKPAQVCTEAPNPATYKPNLFVTTALNQTKVECTWDETPRDRLAVTMRKYTEDEIKGCHDFDNLLAMSSEDEDEEDQEEDEEVEEKKPKKEDDQEEDAGKGKKANKYDAFRQTLLGLIGKKKEKKRDGDLFFSWENPMDKHTSFDSFDTQASQKKKEKGKKKDPKSKVKELTEEEKKEKAKLDLLMMGDENLKAHFSLDDLLAKNTGGKGKKRKLANEKDTDDFKLDTKDKRFEAVFSNYEFNIDPSDKQYKPTKAMEELMNEKIAKKSTARVEEDKSTAKAAKVDETSMLIKSIKTKTQILGQKAKTK